MIAVSAPQIARGRRRCHTECPTTSAGRRYWRSRGRACGTRRKAARSPWTGTAPSAPRFRARSSTAARRARSPRRRTARVSASRNVSRLSDARLQAVSSRNMYSEHGFERADRPRGRAGVPVVDGGVELQARIGAGPGGVADLLPQVARLHGLRDLAGLGAPGEIPVAVGFDRLEELVGDAHRVVRVLAGDGEIGLASPSRCRRSGIRCRCSPAWRTG